MHAITRSVPRLLGTILVLAATVLTPSAQAPPTGLDRATIARIRAEAIDRSQALDHVWWLSEVHGPRPTGSPAFEAASKWAMQRTVCAGRGTRFRVASVITARVPSEPARSLARLRPVTGG